MARAIAGTVLGRLPAATSVLPHPEALTLRGRKTLKGGKRASPRNPSQSLSLSLLPPLPLSLWPFLPHSPAYNAACVRLWRPRSVYALERAEDGGDQKVFLPSIRRFSLPRLSSRRRLTRKRTASRRTQHCPLKSTPSRHSRHLNEARSLCSLCWFDFGPTPSPNPDPQLDPARLCTDVLKTLKMVRVPRAPAPPPRRPALGARSCSPLTNSRGFQVSDSLLLKERHGALSKQTFNGAHDAIVAKSKVRRPRARLAQRRACRPPSSLVIALPTTPPQAISLAANRIEQAFRAGRAPAPSAIMLPLAEMAEGVCVVIEAVAQALFVVCGACSPLVFDGVLPVRRPPPPPPFALPCSSSWPFVSLASAATAAHRAPPGFLTFTPWRGAWALVRARDPRRGVLPGPNAAKRALPPPPTGRSMRWGWPSTHCSPKRPMRRPRLPSPPFSQRIWMPP